MNRHTRPNPRRGIRDPKWEIIEADPHDKSRVLEALREAEKHGYDPKFVYLVDHPRHDEVLCIAVKKRRKRGAGK